MERREFLKSATLGAAGAVVAARATAQPVDAPAEGTPNIIFIVSDQHRAGLTKRSGYPLDTSPTHHVVNQLPVTHPYHLL